MDVRMPDGTIVRNVPEGTTKAQIQKRYGQYRAKIAYEESRANRQNQMARPPNPGVAVPEALASIGSSLISTPVSGLAGIGAGIGNALGLSDTPAADVAEGVGSALTYEPRTDEGRALSDAIAYPFAKLAQGADYAGDVLRRTPMVPTPYIPPEYAGTGAGPEAATIANLLVQSAPAGVAARGASGVRARVGAAKGEPSPVAANAARQTRLEGVPPTIEELAAQSKAAYKAASDAGANISQASFSNLKNRVNVLLKKEGIDPSLHPKASAALKRLNETKGVVSLDDFDTLRKIANDARASVDKADSHMAARIIDEMDDFANNIGPKDASNPGAFDKLREARNLYSRKAKAEEIAELVRRAELSAPNFSASGAENALRTEFRNLAKNKNRMRRFSPEERAAIEKVAKGGPLENTLRFIGKFAPTGFVSTAFGGVLTGATGGIGAVVPAAGMAGRYAATRMTRANALRAEEVMRRGPTQRPRNRPRNALIESTYKVE